MAFFSIPGTTFNGGRDRGWGKKMETSPKHDAWRKSREETKDKSTGMSVGEKHMYGGQPAELIHESHDQHTGRVEQVWRASDRNGSGTKEVTWEKQRDGELRLVRSRPIHS